MLKLGPDTFGSSGQYQYSIVSDFVKGTLFVLARDQEVFNSQYEGEVLEFLQQNGFTHILNKPVKTYQGSDCTYNPNTQ